MGGQNAFLPRRCFAAAKNKPPRSGARSVAFLVFFWASSGFFYFFGGISVVRMFLWTCGLVGLWACGGPVVGLWWACGGPVVGLWACGLVGLWACGPVGLCCCGASWLLVALLLSWRLLAARFSCVFMGPSAFPASFWYFLAIPCGSRYYSDDFNFLFL